MPGPYTLSDEDKEFIYETLKTNGDDINDLYQQWIYKVFQTVTPRPTVANLKKVDRIYGICHGQEYVTRAKTDYGAIVNQKQHVDARLRLEEARKAAKKLRADFFDNAGNLLLEIKQTIIGIAIYNTMVVSVEAPDNFHTVFQQLRQLKYSIMHSEYIRETGETSDCDGYGRSVIMLREIQNLFDELTDIYPLEDVCEEYLRTFDRTTDNPKSVVDVNLSSSSSQSWTMPPVSSSSSSSSAFSLSSESTATESSTVEKTPKKRIRHSKDVDELLMVTDESSTPILTNEWTLKHSKLVTYRESRRRIFLGTVKRLLHIDNIFRKYNHEKEVLLVSQGVEVVAFSPMHNGHLIDLTELDSKVQETGAAFIEAIKERTQICPYAIDKSLPVSCFISSTPVDGDRETSFSITNCANMDVINLSKDIFAAEFPPPVSVSHYVSPS